ILWDISAGKLVPGFQIDIFTENALEFSPDSKILVLVKDDRARGLGERRVVFWDVLGGKQLGKAIPVSSFREAAFLRDSKLLLLKGWNSELLVLDLQGIRWQRKIDWDVRHSQFLITPDPWFLVAWESPSLISKPKPEYEVIDLFTGTTRTTIK